MTTSELNAIQPYTMRFAANSGNGGRHVSRASSSHITTHRSPFPRTKALLAPGILYSVPFLSFPFQSLVFLTRVFVIRLFFAVLFLSLLFCTLLFCALLFCTVLCFSLSISLCFSLFFFLRPSFSLLVYLL